MFGMSCKLPVLAFYCAFNNSYHQSIELYSNNMLKRRCVHNLTPLSAYAEIYKRKTVYNFGNMEKRARKKPAQNISFVRA